MGIFDLKTALEVAGRGDGSVAAIQTAFGVPSCIRNLSNAVLAALPTSILFGMSSELESGVTLADDVVKSIFSVLRDEFGIIEWDTEEGGFTFISKANKNAYDANNGNQLNELAALINGVAGLAGGLYSNYNLVSNQIKAISECINSYRNYLRFKNGNAGTEIAKLDPVAFENYINEKYGVEKARMQEAIDFIDSVNLQLEAINDVIASRVSNPSLEPRFSCSALQYLSGTNLLSDCDTEKLGPTEIFRLVYGPPKSSYGQFILSRDGIYFDSQSSGILPALTYVKDKNDNRLRSTRWRFDSDPNVGGRGDAFSTEDLKSYLHTILDPSITDDSVKLKNYYDKDGFLQELIGQRNKRVYDLSAQISELELDYAPEAIIYNQRQALLAENSFHTDRINKRKKQIELAIKLPYIYNQEVSYAPGEVPINDFSYLAGSNISLDIQKQRALSFSQVEIESVISPISINPIYTVPKVSSPNASLEHLILPSLGDGAIIYDGSSVSSTNSVILPSEHFLVTDSIISMYNFLDTNIESASSTKFSNRNAISDSNEKYAQLVSTGIDYTFKSGLGIPFFNGIVSFTTEGTPNGDGSYLRLPQNKELQDLLYNKNGASIDFWLHTPLLNCSSDGWGYGYVSSLNRIVLANENIGGAGSGTANQFGTQAVRGFLLGLTTDRRITLDQPPSNLFSTNPIDSACFFLAPTQSTDSVKANFISREFYDEDSCLGTNSYHCMKQPINSLSNGKYFSSIGNEFCHVAITLSPGEDNLSFYLDGDLVTTSSISNVFGIPKYQMPNLPSFKKTNSFEYSSGPYLDKYFTPWIVGGGYTDGFSGGNFMGGTYGGIKSGLNGFLGSLKFYSKPLNANEVRENYRAQSGFFKNINIQNLSGECTAPVILLELYSPNTESLRSTRFESSVFNNFEYEDAYVFGRTRPVIAAYGLQFSGAYNVVSNPFATKLWVSGSSPEVSYYTFGSPSATTVKVSRVGVEISSAVVRPRSLNYNWSISGGDLYIDMEPMDKIWVEVNNETSSPMFIFCDPPKPEIPEGNVMYFGPGIHHLSSIPGPHQSVTLTGTDPSGNPVSDTFPGMGFSSFAASGYVSSAPFTVYLDGGAYVIGSLNIKDMKNTQIIGPGILSLENIPKERFANPYFSHQYPVYSYIGERDTGVIAIHGNDNYDELVGDGSFNRVPSGVVVSGITIIDTPFYSIRGVNKVDSVKLLSPWAYNSDGPNVIGDAATKFSYIRDSFMFLADDCIYAPFNAQGPIGGTSAIVSGNIAYSQSNGPMAISYSPRFYFSAAPPFFNDPTYDLIIHDNIIGLYSYNRQTTEVPIRITLDGNTSTSAVINYGLYDITLSNVTIEDTIDGALFWIGNIKDPFNNDGSAYGGMSGITIANVAVSSSISNVGVSANKIYGKNSSSRPYNIAFKNISINGQYITDANRDNYIDWGSGGLTDPDLTGNDDFTFTNDP